MALPTKRPRPGIRPSSPVKGRSSSAEIANRVVNVQSTFTSKERGILASEAARLNVSISTLCRERILAPPPVEEWAEVASEILADWAIQGDNTDTDEKPEKEPRVIRVTTRITMHESVQLRWRAYCLHLSLSDYVRKMVFELPPGQGEDHMAKVSRTGSHKDKTNFYNSVIKIANDGEFPPQTSGFFCKACHSELKMNER